MSKIQTLDAKHEFLREAAAFHKQREETFADVEPLNLPTREEVLKLVTAEKIRSFSKRRFKFKHSARRKNFCQSFRAGFKKFSCGRKVPMMSCRGKIFGRRLTGLSPPS